MKITYIITLITADHRILVDPIILQHKRRFKKNTLQEIVSSAEGTVLSEFKTRYKKGSLGWYIKFRETISATIQKQHGFTPLKNTLKRSCIVNCWN